MYWSEPFPWEDDAVVETRCERRFTWTQLKVALAMYNCRRPDGRATYTIGQIAEYFGVGPRIISRRLKEYMDWRAEQEAKGERVLEPNVMEMEP